MSLQSLVPEQPSYGVRPARRERGARVKLKDKCWSLVTANVTAWMRADELLSAAAGWDHFPDAFLFQETAKCKEQVEETRSGLAGRRLQSAFAPSVRTAALGISAGCAIVGRWSSTWRWLETSDVEKKHPGRLLAAVWSGVLTDGILVASIYAYTGEGAADANRELLELVARELAAYRLPFVIGGDWNMSPRALAETGMPARLRAAVVHPTEATYCAGGAETTIDFFLVSEEVRPAVLSIEVIGGTEVRKRKPVRLVLSGRPRAETVRCLARPPARPMARPAACCPDPADAIRDFNVPEPPVLGSITGEEW